MKKILFILALFTSHFFNYAQTCNVNYFTGNSAYSFAESNDAWWVLTECKIVRINKLNNQTSFYKVGLDLGECIGTGKIVANPNTNEAWVSIYQNGLYHFVNGNWQAVYTSSSYPVGVSGGPQLIGIDNTNRLWFHSTDSLFTFAGASFGAGVAIPLNAGGIINATIDTMYNVWMTVSNGGVLKYNGSTFQKFDTSNSNIENNNCNFIKYDKYDDAIWVGCNHIDSNFVQDSAFVSEFKNNTWTNHLLPQGCSGLSPNVKIADMYHDTSGVWLAAGANPVGCGLIHIQNASLFVYTHCNSNFPNAAYGSVYNISRAMNGQLYVGSDYHGMFVADSSNWQQSLLSNSDFMGTINSCITADRNNNLWVGSNNSGYLQPLYKFDGTTWQQVSTAPAGNLYADRCTTYNGDTVYFGCSAYNDQYYSYDAVNNAFHLTSSSFITPATTSYFEGNFCSDINNALWIDGISSTGPTVDKIPNGMGAPSIFLTSNFGIYSEYWGFRVAAGNSNDMWFCSYDTLSHWNGSTYTLYTFPIGAGFINTRDMKVDKLGRVWIITDMYIEMFDGSHLYEYNLTPNITYSNEGSKIYVDNSNNIYIGTGPNTVPGNGTGLYVFDGGTWMNYNTSSTNFLNNDIVNITGDNNGGIWLGTNKGVTQFHACGGSVIPVVPVLLNVKEVKNYVSTFSIYPNPASDKINIVNDNNASISSLTILDMNGKIVLQQSGQLKKQLDISMLKAGSYLIQIRTDSGIFIDKLSVIR